MVNVNLLPEGAFEPLASVANNLIDKLYTVTGYVFIPKGKRKDMKEAVEFFIEEIKNNEKMPILAKAAAISDARKLIREYCNQQDILSIAMENLLETAEPNLIDSNWLIEFWERSKKVNDEEIKLLFGKILAEACNNAETQIPKSLIHKLCLMDLRIVKRIQELSKYVVKLCLIDIDGNKICEELKVFYYGENYEWIKKYVPKFEMFELDSLGWVKCGQYTTSFEDEFNKASKPIKELRVYYNNNYFSISERNNKCIDLTVPEMIPSGTICLTNDGQYIMNILENKTYLEDYFEDLKSIFRMEGYIVI